MTMLLNPYVFVGGSNNDPYFNNVSLLCHFDGTNGSTTITDNSTSAHTIVAHDGAALSTLQFKYGTAALRTTAAPQYVSVSASTGFSFPGDYTIEFWLYPTSVSAANSIMVEHFDQGTGVVSGFWSVQINPSQVDAGIRYVWGTGVGTTSAAISQVSAITVNTWNFVAITQNAGSVQIWINGAASGAAKTNATDLTINYALDIAGRESASPMLGWMDDLRITKGVARYTTNFTPPTQAFPNS